MTRGGDSLLFKSWRKLQKAFEEMNDSMKRERRWLINEFEESQARIYIAVRGNLLPPLLDRRAFCIFHCQFTDVSREKLIYNSRTRVLMDRKDGNREKHFDMRRVIREKKHTNYSWNLGMNRRLKFTWKIVRHCNPTYFDMFHSTNGLPMTFLADWLQLIDWTTSKWLSNYF